MKLSLQPGITGLWQVYGRSKTAFDEMVRLEIRYINRQSFLLDLKILMQIPHAVPSVSGAY
jgi:lipopolysaccharide/colanic/teichoic acid biosynthesis glycosyltransferase